MYIYIYTHTVDLHYREMSFKNQMNHSIKQFWDRSSSNQKNAGVASVCVYIYNIYICVCVFAYS